MGKSQRIKGRAFEQWVARDLREIFPNARRGLQFQQGGRVCDIEETPFHIECSIGGESIWAKWQQACWDASLKPGNLMREPIVIKKRDREETVVLMNLFTFKRLCRTGAHAS